MGEAEEETDLSRARALGAAWRVCICPEGMRSAWSQSARHSGGSPVNEGESEERERERDGDTVKQSTPAVRITLRQLQQGPSRGGQRFQQGCSMCVQSSQHTRGRFGGKMPPVPHAESCTPVSARRRGYFFSPRSNGLGKHAPESCFCSEGHLSLIH